MSPLGKKVMADFERLLDTTKKIFEEKNVGDELQNAIYYGSKATKDVTGKSTEIKTTYDLSSLKELLKKIFFLKSIRICNGS